MLSRIVIRKSHWIAGLSDVPNQDWRVWPHVRAVVRAAAAGPVLCSAETAIAQRIFARGNSNWSGSGTFTQAIEFPELAQFARSLGFPRDRLHGSFSRTHAVKAWLKMELCVQQFGVVATRRARQALREEMALWALVEWPLTGLAQLLRLANIQNLLVTRFGAELQQVARYRDAIEREEVA